MFRIPVAIATSLFLLAVPLRPGPALAQHGGHGGGGHVGGGGHPGGGFAGHGSRGVIRGGHPGIASFSGSGVHYRSRFPQHDRPHGIGGVPGLGHGRRFAHGFPGFGFRHGLTAGIIVGAFPFYSFWNGFAYPYYGYGPPYYYGPRYHGGAPPGRVPDDVSSGIPVPGDRIAVPGRAGSDSLIIEQLTDSIVRLTWLDPGREVAEVGLFLADSERRVITAQTLADPPFMALFEPASYATMAGATVVWPDGRTSTTLVEYRRSPP